MAEIAGLTGLRPGSSGIAKIITSPPYDVIKPGSGLEKLLQENENSFWHITLGDKPKDALGRLVSRRALIRDDEPCFYVYSQEFDSWNGQRITRLGFFAAPAVAQYETGDIIRHEQTFDDKVQGRLELAKQLGMTIEPIFLLTKSRITDMLREIADVVEPLYDFVSDFGAQSELHGIHNRIYRIPASSSFGQALANLIRVNALYIADGHHRYHSALLNNQANTLAYIVEADEIKKTRGIQAYNRAINGTVVFEDGINEISKISGVCVEEQPALIGVGCPNRGYFWVYTNGKVYWVDTAGMTRADDPVEGLDCKVLEQVVYPALGLTESMLSDSGRFEYYPEQDNDKITALVDSGSFNAGIGLHAVSVDEVIAVADAGLKEMRENGNIAKPHFIMPKKSTFFAPKILSGLFLYGHEYR